MPSNMDASDFDAEEIDWNYRFAHESGDKALAESLREQWAAFDGEDSLHEMAFGEPIEPVALDQRMLKVSEMIQATIDATARSALEKNLVWLAQVETVPPAVPRKVRRSSDPCDLAKG
jgi:hypothetical protein